MSSIGLFSVPASTAHPPRWAVGVSRHVAAPCPKLECTTSPSRLCSGAACGAPRVRVAPGVSFRPHLHHSSSKSRLIDDGPPTRFVVRLAPSSRWHRSVEGSGIDGTAIRVKFAPLTFRISCKVGPSGRGIRAGSVRELLACHLLGTRKTVAVSNTPREPARGRRLSFGQLWLFATGVRLPPFLHKESSFA